MFAAIKAFLLLAATTSVTISWQPGAGGPAPSGYRVYYGTSHAAYTQNVDAGPALTKTITGLNTGTTYYFAVKAYVAGNVMSNFSNEIGYNAPAPTPQISPVPLTTPPPAATPSPTPKKPTLGGTPHASPTINPKGSR